MIIPITLVDATPSHITNSKGYFRVMNSQSKYGQRYLKTPNSNRWMQWSDIDREFTNFFNEELKDQLDSAFEIAALNTQSNNR